MTRAHDIIVPGFCRNILDVWMMLGNKQKSSLPVLQKIAGLLEEWNPKVNRKMVFQPMAVSTREQGPLRLSMLGLGI